MADYFLTINTHKRWAIIEVTFKKGVVFKNKQLKSFQTLAKAREYMKKIKGGKK